jgi:hypothetical protein
MRALVRLIVWMVLDLFRSRAALEAEIRTLRQQINVLRRTAPKKQTFSAIDRLIFVCFYRLVPGVRDALAIVKPETVVSTANQIRAYWWCSPPRIGRQRMRPTVSAGRDIGASLCNDKWVRVPLYNTTTERPRDRGGRASLSVASLGRMPGPYS